MKRLTDAFSSIFSDQEWFNKVLVGGFFLLLAPLGIGMLMLNGYLEEYLQGVKRGERAMPYWRNSSAILRKGFRRSGFPLLVLATAVTVSWNGLLVITLPIGIALLVLFLTINTAILVGRITVIGTILSVLLMLLAISFGWMWIVVGWPLLVFLTMLIQVHLFTA